MERHHMDILCDKAVQHLLLIARQLLEWKKLLLDDAGARTPAFGMIGTMPPHVMVLETRDVLGKCGRTCVGVVLSDSKLSSGLVNLTQ